MTARSLSNFTAGQYTLATGATGATGASCTPTQCSLRYNVDMTSNPEPLGPGLIVTAAQSNPGPFYCPLILSTGLGIASAYDIQSDTFLTFNGTDSFTCNIAGAYSMGCNIPTLKYAAYLGPIEVFAQILINGQSIFGGAPGFTDSKNLDVSLVTTPVDPTFDYVCTLDGSANVYLNVGDIISLAVFVSIDQVVLSFIGNFWINLEEVGGCQTGATGATGPSGADGATGPTGTGASAGTFEGICVHLDADLVYTANTDVTNYAIDFSPGQFYTSANFNLTTGEYTVPEDGYYTILLSQGNALTNFYIVYDGTPLQGPEDGVGSALIQFTPYLLNGNVVSVRSSQSGTIPKLNSGIQPSINYCLSINKWAPLQGATGATGQTGPGAVSFEGCSVYIPTTYSYTYGNDIFPWASTFPGFYHDPANFDLSTGQYTIPASGYYLIQTNMYTSGGQIMLMVNGTLFSTNQINYGLTNITNYFTTGDVLTFQLEQSATITQYDTTTNTYGSVMSITRVEGVQGSTGATGPAGAITQESFQISLGADWTSTATTSYENITGWIDVVNPVDAVDTYTSGLYQNLTSGTLNLANGTFTVGMTGNYYFSVNFGYNYAPGNAIRLAINGTEYYGMSSSGVTEDTFHVISGIIPLTSGDVVSVVFYSTAPGAVLEYLNYFGPPSIDTYAWQWTMSLVGGIEGATGATGAADPILSINSFAAVSNTVQAIGAANVGQNVVLESGILMGNLTTNWTVDGTNTIFTGTATGWYLFIWRITVSYPNITAGQVKVTGGVRLNSAMILSSTNTNSILGLAVPGQDMTCTISGSTLYPYTAGEAVNLTIICDDATLTIGDPNFPVGGGWASFTPQTTAELSMICVSLL